MINASLERCLSFISSQTTPAVHIPEQTMVRRAVTISRQPGCGGVLVADKLAAYLQQHSPAPHAAWTVFDRDLMQQVLAEHHLPAHLEKHLPEDRISLIEDTLADIFGVRPTAETVVQQTAETMLKLASLGNVILVGRGGNFVTAKLPHVLHVRLVGELEDRIERIIRDDGKSPAEARRFCQEEEQSRARYIKTYFRADINHPANYHMIINTSRVGVENGAKLIGDAVLRL
jgi:cytidylate kinase